MTPTGENIREICDCIRGSFSVEELEEFTEDYLKTDLSDYVSENISKRKIVRKFVLAVHRRQQTRLVLEQMAAVRPGVACFQHLIDSLRPKPVPPAPPPSPPVPDPAVPPAPPDPVPPPGPPRAAPAPTGQPRPRPRRKAWWLITCVLLAAGGGVVAWRHFTSTPPPNERVLEVLLPKPHAYPEVRNWNPDCIESVTPVEPTGADEEGSRRRFAVKFREGKQSGEICLTIIYDEAVEKRVYTVSRVGDPRWRPATDSPPPLVPQ
jgi:hypothetical protein